MADVIIMRWGGNFGAFGGVAYGAIGADYPSGSICSCTGQTSGKKIKAADTSGKVVFVLPGADIWTIEARVGELMRAKDVLIDNDKRCETVRLRFSTLIFDGGKACEYSGGWNSQLGSGGNIRLSIDGGFSTTYDVGTYGTSNESIDLTEFNRLIITVPEISGCSKAFFYFADEPGGEMGINSIPSPAKTWELYEGENLIDVEGWNGTHYFGFCIVEGKGSADPAVMEVSKIEGE